MNGIKEKIIEVHNSQSIEKTIGILLEMQTESLNDKNFIEFIKENFANNIYKNEIDFFRYVQKWIFDHIEYTDDLYDETLISPRVMIKILKGDCDDFAVFIKTILAAFNIKSNFILLGQSYGIFSHIAVYIPSYNIILDGTNSKFNYVDFNKYKFYKLVG